MLDPVFTESNNYRCVDKATICLLGCYVDSNAFDLGCLMFDRETGKGSSRERTRNHKRTQKGNW